MNLKTFNNNNNLIILINSKCFLYINEGPIGVINIRMYIQGLSRRAMRAMLSGLDRHLHPNVTTVPSSLKIHYKLKTGERAAT